MSDLSPCTTSKRFKENSFDVQAEAVIDVVLPLMRLRYKSFTLQNCKGDDVSLGQSFVSVSLEHASKVLNLENEGEHKGEHKKSLSQQLCALWQGADGNSEAESKVVLLQGNAGMGKTTLLRWIAFKWAHKTLWDDKFDALVMLRGKAACMVQTMEEALLANGFDNDLVDQFAEWCKKNKSRVVWLLDDWTRKEEVETDFPYWMKANVEYVICAACSFMRPTHILSGFDSPSAIERFVWRFFDEFDAERAALTVLLCMRARYPSVYRYLRQAIVQPILQINYNDMNGADCGKTWKLVKNAMKQDWLEDACRNPLILKCLCSVAQNSKEIQLTKVFQQVLNSILEATVEEHRKSLRFVAWESFSRQDRRVVDPMGIASLCGLLSTDGGWTDLAVAEFLAAEFVCFDMKEDEIGKRLIRIRQDFDHDSFTVFFSFVIGLGGNAIACLKDWYPPQEWEDFSDDAADMLEDAGPLIWLSEAVDDTLETFLRSHWRNFMETGKGVSSLLRTAANIGALKAVKFFLDNTNVEVDCQSSSGWSPLLLAAESGHAEIVSLLLNKGANINLQLSNDDPCTALLLAARCGSLDVVTCLVQNKTCNLSGPSTSKSSDVNFSIYDPLCAATFNGHGQVVTTLLQHGAKVDKDETLLLHYAAQHGMLDLVKYLVFHCGVSVNSKDDSDDELSFPLFAAVGSSLKENTIDVVKFLLQNGADVHAVNATGSSSLHYACSVGSVDAAKELIRYGADVHLKDEDGYSPLLSAVEHGRIDTLQLLLDHGADVNIVDNSNDSALHLACGAGNVALALRLLQYGAHPNVIGFNSWTPLLIAAQKGLHVVVARLIECGASVNVRNNKKLTPLITASIRGHVQVVNVLLENKADVNSLCKGEPAIWKAVRKGHLEVVKRLIEHGADVMISLKKSGWLIVHQVAEEGNTELLKYLILTCPALARAVTIRSKANALHVAAAAGQLEIVRSILGVAPEVLEEKTTEGLKPLDCALILNNQTVATYLASRGTKSSAGLTLPQRHCGMTCSNLHVLTLSLRWRGWKCNACGEKGVSAISYFCSACDFDICMACVKT